MYSQVHDFRTMACRGYMRGEGLGMATMPTWCWMFAQSSVVRLGVLSVGFNIATWGAAIAGAPESPTPGPTPVGWLEFHDDLLADAVLNDDDFRTGGLGAGARIGWALLVVDASVLTSRGNYGYPAERCDELTATANWLREWDAPNREWRWSVAAGGGVRVAGNLGGERSQNGIHGFFGYQPLHVDYEVDCRLAGVAVTSARGLWAGGSGPLGHWGIGSDVGGLISTYDERQATAGVSLVALGGEGVAWIGGRHLWHGGKTQSDTARVVADHEQGWWVESGISAGPMMDARGDLDPLSVWFEAGVNPGTRAVAGSVGALYRPGAASLVADKPLQVEPVWLYMPGGGGGLQIRWLPQSWRWLGNRGAIVADYRHGSVPNTSWNDNDLTFNQWTVGVQPTIGIPLFPRVSVEGFAHGDVGVVAEGVLEKGPNPRFTADRSLTGVVTGGIGLGVAVDCIGDAAAKHGLLSVRVSSDGSLPFQSNQAVNGVDRADYLEPMRFWVLAVGMSLRW